MNKLIYVVVLILSISFVFAIDKTVLSIDNCFNISVHEDLLQGNYTDFHFKDCSKIDDSWLCDCHNSGTFNLTMQTDGTNLDSVDWRYYRLDVDYATYTLDYSSGALLVVDYGGGFNLKANGIEYQGENLVEVNRIVYQDRFIERNITIPEIHYVDRNITIEKIVEVSNTSELVFKSIMIANLTDTNSSLRRTNDSFYWIEILTIIIALIIILILKFKK